MTQDFASIRDWLSLASVAISVGTAIWIMLTSGSKKTASELTEFKKEAEIDRKLFLDALQQLTNRTQSLESDMKHLPDAKAMMEMRLALSDLKGQVGRMEESQIGVSRTVHRVEDFLMKGGVAA